MLLGSLFVADLIVGMEELGLHYRCRGRSNLWKIRIPSDTKLLLTKNYSEIIIFAKITNLTRNSLKMSFFPGHFKRAECLGNYEK